MKNQIVTSCFFLENQMRLQKDSATKRHWQPVSLLNLRLDLIEIDEINLDKLDRYPSFVQRHDG